MPASAQHITSTAPSPAAAPTPANALSDIYGGGAAPDSLQRVSSLRTELNGLVDATARAFTAVEGYMVPKLADDIRRTCITIGLELRDALRLSERVLTTDMTVGAARDADSSIVAALADSKDVQLITLRQLLGVPNPAAGAQPVTVELIQRFERLHSEIGGLATGPVREVVQRIEAEAAEANRINSLHTGATAIAEQVKHVLEQAALDIADVEPSHRVGVSFTEALAQEAQRIDGEIAVLQPTLGQKQLGREALGNLHAQKVMCEPLGEVVNRISALLDGSVTRTPTTVEIQLGSLQQAKQALIDGKPIDGVLTSPLNQQARDTIAAKLDDGIAALTGYRRQALGVGTGPTVTSPVLRLGEVDTRGIGISTMRAFLVAEGDSVTMKIVGTAPYPRDRGQTHPVISVRLGSIADFESPATAAELNRQSAALPKGMTNAAIAVMECVANNQRGAFARFGGFDDSGPLVVGLHTLQRSGTIGQVAIQEIDRKSLASRNFGALPSIDMRLGKEIDPGSIGIGQLRAFMVAENGGVYLKLVSPPKRDGLLSLGSNHSVLSIRVRQLGAGQDEKALNSKEAAIPAETVALVGRILDLVRRPPADSFLPNGKFHAAGQLTAFIEGLPGVISIGVRDVSARHIAAGRFT